MRSVNVNMRMRLNEVEMKSLNEKKEIRPI